MNSSPDVPQLRALLHPSHHSDLGREACGAAGSVLRAASSWTTGAAYRYVLFFPSQDASCLTLFFSFFFLHNLTVAAETLRISSAGLGVKTVQGI